MKPFMDKNFLLDTDTARQLFHETSSGKPVWDFHCHLIPRQIAENKQFSDLTEVWLGGDHYKWRQMRTFGIDETYITGDADPYEKFAAWAATVEKLIGNPLYHWTHLELQRYFGIYEPLTVESAHRIWEEANKQLHSDNLTVKGIFKKMNVYAVGTTDDPVDTLEYHKAIADGTAAIGSIDTKVVPSFRPDKAIHIDAPDFAGYIRKLSEAAGIPIATPDDVLAALALRLDYFIAAGCRASDHALEYPPVTASVKDTEAEKNTAFAAFKSVLNGEQPDRSAADTYRAYILTRLAKLYREKNIVMQLHIAAIRNNNPIMMRKLGPDTGYDAVHDCQISASLASLLGRIEEEGGLPKTVLYTLNPKDYYPLATLMGCYQSGQKGKIQLGSAWWFCDHKDGMTEQLTVLGNLGMLSCFIGMLTDSRSFLSYPRHEYFRRILCNIIGTWVENGEYPADMRLLSEIVSGISFDNALHYFEN